MMVSTTRRQPEFEISGGDLALDLANTKERRPAPEPVELVHSYDDLLTWGAKAEAIGLPEAATLRALAARNPRAARAALAQAIDLREAIFAVFSAVARGRPLPEAALARLNRALPAALARLRLAEGGSSWAWASEPHLDRVLWPALRAAALLLTSPNREHVRQCAARDCDWLFLDKSRNGSRRWCNMAVCGNREKARRFQRRSRSSE